VEKHPKAAQLARFVEGAAPRSQARVLVTHLLRGCSDCVTAVEQTLRPQRELSPDAYDAAFDNAFATVQEHLPTLAAPARPQPKLILRRGVLSLPGSPI